MLSIRARNPPDTDIVGVLQKFKVSFNLLVSIYFIVTSLTGAVVKYCDESLCLCVSLSVCLSVCVSLCLYVREDISGTTCVIFTKFLCMLHMSVALSSSSMLTIGRIAYCREGGDGRRRSVIYDCVVVTVPVPCHYYALLLDCH